jgi:hypothetical protein
VRDVLGALAGEHRLLEVVDVVLDRVGDLHVGVHEPVADRVRHRPRAERQERRRFSRSARTWLRAPARRAGR